MLDTSAIRGILWLVLRSEDAYPAVNGVDMYQLVSQSLMQEYKTRKKGRKRASLISETYFIDLRPFDYTDVLVLWGNPRWDNLSCLDFTGLVSATKRKALKRIISNDKMGTSRSNDATATRTSLKKSICVLSVFVAISLTHLLCQLEAISPKAEFQGTIYKLRERNKISSLLVYVLFSLLSFPSTSFLF